MGRLSTVWRHMRRSPYQTLSAIFTITLVFILIAFSMLTLLRAQADLAFLESIPQVNAFFKDEAKIEDINKLRGEIEKREDVASVRFVSKEEALRIYQEQNKDDPLLLSLVTADLLPASLEVSAKKAENLGDIAQAFRNSEVVENVIFQKDLVDKLIASIKQTRRTGLLLTLILASISTFIILTIVGIRVSQRREEIEIARLLGASSWYIRWPFILEGMIYGVIGAIFAWSISYIVLLIDDSFYRLTIYSWLLSTREPSAYSLLTMLTLLGLELLLGLLLGFIGSFLAVLRYLR